MKIRREMSSIYVIDKPLDYELFDPVEESKPVIYDSFPLVLQTKRFILDESFRAHC